MDVPTAGGPVPAGSALGGSARPPISTALDVARSRSICGEMLREVLVRPRPPRTGPVLRGPTPRRGGHDLQNGTSDPLRPMVPTYVADDLRGVALARYREG